MKILFVTHISAQARHFVQVLEQLVAGSHEVTLMAASKQRDRAMRLPDFLQHLKQLRIVPLVEPGQDFWAPYRASIRNSAHYLTYFHPRLAGARPARERAWTWTDPGLRRWLGDGGPAPTLGARHLFRALETALPPDPAIEEALREGDYDAVLVTPLIFNECTHQLDYVKAAQELGIPVGFPVFSWDNLSTKGAVSVLPDQVFVWNRTQQAEAREIHGVPDDRIKVLGAWRFDEFAALTPHRDRDAFCSEFGFDSTRPIILYLGSSPFIAPEEHDFVAEWLRRLRGAEDKRVRDSNVLLRAHPRTATAWHETTANVLNGRVALQDAGATSFFDAQFLFDALHHCSAVVGANTSAMLEAAVLGVPVHSLRHPLLDRAQREIIHFEYLNDGGRGLLHLADSWDRHLIELSESLERPMGEPDPRTLAFRASFIDPPGSGDLATERLVAEISSLAERPPGSAAPRMMPRIVRGVLGPFAKAAIRGGLLKMLPHWKPAKPSAAVPAWKAEKASRKLNTESEDSRPAEL